MKLFVEASGESGDNTLYWVPLNTTKRCPDHFVSDGQGNELGAICYVDYSILCMM